MTLIHSQKFHYDEKLYKIQSLFDLIRNGLPTKSDYESFKKHISEVTGFHWKTILYHWGRRKQGDVEVPKAHLEKLAEEFTKVLNFHITAEDLINRPGNTIEVRVNFDQELKKSSRWKKTTEFYKTLAKYPHQYRNFILVNLTALLGEGHEPKSLKFLRDYLQEPRNLILDICNALNGVKAASLDRKSDGEIKVLIEFFNDCAKRHLRRKNETVREVKPLSTIKLVDVG